MKPEQQRIAIAKACGWAYHNIHPRYGKQSVKSWYYRDSDTTVSHKSSLPDYLNDLNAMYEAEIWLKPSQWPTYHSHLVESWNDDPKPVYAYETHATAAQRAEAFLKTLNLWTEG